MTTPEILNASDDPAVAALLAEMAALKQENSALKEKGQRAVAITVKSACMTNGTDANGNPGKGTVGVYGTGRFPVSAYPNQWAKILRNAAHIGQYILDNEATLGFKDGQREPVLAFFQAAMPLVDGVTREGRAIWVLRVSPVKPRRFLSAKARPLLAFMPLTAVCVGLAIPLVAGRGPVAMAVATLGAVAVYLAFMGVGAWAGAAYPSLDRHSHAPPDLVLAFYLMFGCLVLEGLMLFPVLAIANFDPMSGVIAAGFAVVVGLAIMLLGITAGGRVLSSLEVS